MLNKMAIKFFRNSKILPFSGIKSESNQNGHREYSNGNETLEIENQQAISVVEQKWIEIF